MYNFDKTRIYSGIAACILTFSLTSGCSLKKEEVKETESSLEIHEPVLEEKYVFHYETDTIDAQSEIDKLGIIKDESLPKDVYKVIRFIDNNHFERIGIVKAYVKYNTNENGEVVSEYYEVYDVFNNNYLFTCDNLDDIHTDEIYYISSYDKLDKLRDIVISKGMDETYTDSILSTINGRNNLSLSEVAYVYVMLVRSNNRLDNSNIQLKMSNN